MSVHTTFDLLQLLFQILVSSSGFQLRFSLEQDSVLHQNGLFSRCVQERARERLLNLIFSLDI